MNTSLISAILALISFGSLAALDATGNLPIIQASTEVVATASIAGVVSTSQSLYMLNGGDWVETLDRTAATSSSQGSTTAVGPVVMWAVGTACFEATVPSPDTPIDVVSCAVPQQP